MNKKLIVLLPILTGGVCSPLLAQDSPADACREAAKLIEQNDIDGALEEARWCVEGLQQLKQKAMSGVFPDEVNGFKGEDVQSQSAMGMNITERTYNRGSESIDVTLTAAGSAGGGFAAAIAQMGMTMGGAGKKMRIQRQTVMDLSEGSNNEFTVALKSGGVLSFQSSSAKHDDVVEFIKSFPLAELDEASSQ
ncbi:MAG: hypothetical protein KDJ38_20130 [Gammaproteobacteria bacterium]|nr:hypothetical protein [Gammaproteobacteria bacterium]